MIHFCYYKCYILKKYIGISFQCISLILCGFACGITLRSLLLRSNRIYFYFSVLEGHITSAAYYNVKSIYMKLATANKPTAIIGYVNKTPYGYMTGIEDDVGARCQNISIRINPSSDFNGLFSPSSC